LIIILVGRAAQFFLALLMMRVGTTLLSPQEMGRVSLVLTTTACFSLFLINPVGMFINRRLHTWQSGGVARDYLRRFAVYLMGVALLAAITLPVLYWLGWGHFGLKLPWLIFLVCTSLVFSTLNQTAIPSLNLLGDSGRFVLLSILTLLSSFFCAVALVKVGGPSAQNWILGLLLGQIVIGIVGVHVLFSRLMLHETCLVTPCVGSTQLRALFNYAWPVAIAAGLAWVQGQGYRYLLSGRLGLDQLGLFVAGYAVSAGSIAGFESVLTTYFQPRLYRDVSVNPQPEQQALAWQRYAAAVIPSLILTVMFIVMATPELTRLFLGQKFQMAASFVMWGALAEAARVLMGVYALIAHVRMRTRWLILPNTVGAILSIVGCFVLIPHLGAIGAGVGLASSGLVVVLLMHILFARHVGGGSSGRPMLLAVACGAMLWGGVVVLRHWWHGGSWGRMLAILAIAGLVELFVQYFFLRNHMTERLSK